MDDKRECECYMPWQSRIDAGNQKKVDKKKKEGDTVILLFASSVPGKSQRILFKADKSSNRDAWEVIKAYWPFKWKLQENNVIDSIWETKEKDKRTGNTLSS